MEEDIPGTKEHLRLFKESDDEDFQFELAVLKRKLGRGKEKEATTSRAM